MLEQRSHYIVICNRTGGVADLLASAYKCIANRKNEMITENLTNAFWAEEDREIIRLELNKFYTNCANNYKEHCNEFCSENCEKNCKYHCREKCSKIHCR